MFSHFMMRFFVVVLDNTLAGISVFGRVLIVIFFHIDTRQTFSAYHCFSWEVLLTLLALKTGPRGPHLGLYGSVLGGNQ